MLTKFFFFMMSFISLISTAQSGHQNQASKRAAQPLQMQHESCKTLIQDEPNLDQEVSLDPSLQRFQENWLQSLAYNERLIVLMKLVVKENLIQINKRTLNKIHRLTFIFSKAQLQQNLGFYDRIVFAEELLNNFPITFIILHPHLGLDEKIIFKYLHEYCEQIPYLEVISFLEAISIFPLKADYQSQLNLKLLELILFKLQPQRATSITDNFIFRIDKLGLLKTEMRLLALEKIQASLSLLKPGNNNGYPKSQSTTQERQREVNINKVVYALVTSELSPSGQQELLTRIKLEQPKVYQELALFRFTQR